MFSFGVTDLQAAKKAPTPPSSIALDDDAQKRNTDCIYFLASPLTCKKGNKCEYRHSEAARTNPRDCRFWKSGNCLNAYCSFRHLPLEGKQSAAPVTSTSMAYTKAPSVPAMSTAAGVGPSKSKTPCYFFAQGCCAKNDQCPFMHGMPAASSTAEAAAQQNHVGGDGKALHSSGRPLILLKQSGLLPQEIRPSTNGRPEALNEAHTSNTTTSRAPALPKQGVPYGSERAALPEGIDNPRNVSSGSKYSQNNKKMLQNEDNFQVLAQAGELKNQNSYLTEALWEVGPSGGGSGQSFRREEGDTSSSSNSQESLKGRSSSPACDGQDSDKGDLRAHLAKRMKINSSLTSSRGNGYLPDLATQCHRGGRRSDHHLTQRKQEQGEVIRKVGEEADVGRVKGAQLNRRQSAEAPKQGQSRSFAVNVHDVEAVAKPENGVLLPSSDLRSKRLVSGSVKETLSFTGPKSLAQIKAEKMAGGNSGFKAIGRLDSRSTVAEANSRLDSRSIIAEGKLKLSGRTLAVPADIRNASATNEKGISSHMKFLSTTKQDDALKHEMMTAEEFEGPKPLSTLLKRKRGAESGGMVKESMSGLSKPQVSESTCLGEMEDGEFRSNDDSSNVDDMDAPVSSQEDGVDTSASTEEVMRGLQGSLGEAAECGTESSDDGSKADVDMEENVYAGDDHEMDGDDDDEDDFAKKLGRVFGLSPE